jgi:hydroxyquinol 1,2-dioxygenase
LVDSVNHSDDTAVAGAAASTAADDDDDDDDDIDKNCLGKESTRTPTETTILGPFYREESPHLENGSLITTPEELAKGSSLWVDCCVVDGPTDIPVTNATVEVWQASAEGLYDVQRDLSSSSSSSSPPTSSSSTDLRAIFRPTTDQGRFWFQTVQPSSYPIPTDGPVGELLQVMGKHPYRPAHIHFRISAPGFETLTTHLFLEGDPYLSSDAVHAVKDSLIVGLAEKTTDGRTAYELNYTFRMKGRRPRRGLNDRYLVD